MIVMFLLLGTSLLSAQTAQDILEKVKEKYDEVTDVQIKFTQHVRLKMSRVDQTTPGTLSVKKKNKYRIELEDQTIVTNGETVWSYSRPSNQVLVDYFKLDERSLTPERVLTGAPEDFEATSLGKAKIGKLDVMGLKLLPKQDNAFIHSMKLWVDQKDWLIRKVEMVDMSGKETTYLVNDIRTNTGVQDSRFTYQVPEGVEVVDLR